MDRPRGALLYAPPRDPVRLGEDDEVVLGRSRRCDVPVPSAQASRRHASVRREGDHYVVVDLGSTNGTFVNGVALAAPRPLRHGDRIEIGEVTVTYCEVDGDKSEGLDEARTALFDAPAEADSVEVLRGDLEEIPAYAVLQMLELGRKSGRLSIETPLGPARLWLREGRPVHAEFQDTQGLEAASRIAEATAGHFLFEVCASAPAETIQAALTEILLEATRLQDERTP